MTSELHDRIQEDVKTAMRARDKARLGVLRMLTAAIKQKEVDTRTSLDDGGVVAVVGKMVKQRQDAAEQFLKGGRQDLVDQERYEIEVLEAYLPAQLDDSELEEIIRAAVVETGAATMKDMGKVMGVLKGRLQGRADMGAVSARVKTHLSNPA